MTGNEDQRRPITDIDMIDEAYAMNKYSLGDEDAQNTFEVNITEDEVANIFNEDPTLETLANEVPSTSITPEVVSGENKNLPSTVQYSAKIEDLVRGNAKTVRGQIQGTSKMIDAATLVHATHNLITQIEEVPKQLQEYSVQVAGENGVMSAKFQLTGVRDAKTANRTSDEDRNEAIKNITYAKPLLAASEEVFRNLIMGNMDTAEKIIQDESLTKKLQDAYSVQPKSNSTAITKQEGTPLTYNGEGSMQGQLVAAIVNQYKGVANVQTPDEYLQNLQSMIGLIDAHETIMDSAEAAKSALYQDALELQYKGVDHEISKSEEGLNATMNAFRARSIADLNDATDGETPLTTIVQGLTLTSSLEAGVNGDEKGIAAYIKNCETSSLLPDNAQRLYALEPPKSK